MNVGIPQPLPILTPTIGLSSGDKNIYDYLPRNRKGVLCFRGLEKLVEEMLGDTCHRKAHNLSLQIFAKLKEARQFSNDAHIEDLIAWCDQCESFHNLVAQVARQTRLPKEGTEPNPRAIYGLGMRYYYGNGVPVDRVNAIRLFTQAAKKGNLDAQNNLGVCYQIGEAGVKNLGKAFKLFTQAAEGGHVRAMNNIGVCEWDKAHIDEAIRWFKLAADKGNADAQNNLALCYENSLEEKKAIELYAHAAEGGHAGAQNNFGVCQAAAGIDTSSFTLFTQAADGGDVYAKYNLALCYQYGLAEKNLYKAHKLYKQAKEGGVLFDNFTASILPDQPGLGQDLGDSDIDAEQYELDDLQTEAEWQELSNGLSDMF